MQECRRGGRGHYLSIFPLSGVVAYEEKLLKAKQTNGSDSSACRGTGLLGKLQSPGEPPCHVLRLRVTCPGCLCRSRLKRAKPAPHHMNLGYQAFWELLIYTWLIGTSGLLGGVTGGRQGVGGGCWASCPAISVLLITGPMHLLLHSPLLPGPSDP
ncbi:hypothetical protein NQZ68_003647 [Dissostichus eleginoides]|nr:hypothetical protein NQZ68_003647 [Dissostichus eleginoides]